STLAPRFCSGQRAAQLVPVAKQKSVQGRADVCFRRESQTIHLPRGIPAVVSRSEAPDSSLCGPLTSRERS
ncbi:MAG: hypothetical protein NT069_10540, partial [Planctomycetota bacterium]|nr:hypothetical protein [Planctomycetota bacterium]